MNKEKRKRFIIIIIAVFIIGVIAAVIGLNSTNENNHIVENKEVDLLKYVQGFNDDKSVLKLNSQSHNFLKDITYDKQVFKEISVDTSDIDYYKEGAYEVIYTIIPVDPNIKSVKKKISVEVISDNQDNKIKDTKQNTSIDSSDNVKTSKDSDNINSNKNTQQTNTSKHTHQWVKQYKTVHHSEKGHNEKYVVKEAWTESVPIYGMDERVICNACGVDITDLGQGGIIEHIKQHTLAGESGGYHSQWVQIQTGTNTINHPAEYGTRYVVDQKAYNEKVFTGYKCSCGATK